MMNAIATKPSVISLFRRLLRKMSGEVTRRATMAPREYVISTACSSTGTIAAKNQRQIRRWLSQMNTQTGTAIASINPAPLLSRPP